MSCFVASSGCCKVTTAQKNVCCNSAKLADKQGHSKHRHLADAYDHFVSCSNLAENLFILFLYNNDFEGDLSVVSGARLGVVSTADNPKLCGMVPASVRWAHGYNPYNTSLGMPCP